MILQLGDLEIGTALSSFDLRPLCDEVVLALVSPW